MANDRLPAAREVATIDGAGAIVIGACGFEDRTLALSECLQTASSDKAILLVYKDWAPDNRVEEVTAAYRKKGLMAEQIAYDRFSPDAFADELSSRMEAMNGTSVILDISTMSKMAILLCLEVCRERNVETRLFYCEAREYGPTQDQYQAAKADPNFHRPSIQIYSGVSGVIRASRLSSVSMQGEPSTAIAFMSMNELLTQALLTSIYPSRLFLVNGRPPVHRWRERATAWIHEPLRAEWPEADNPVVVEPDGSTLPLRSTSTLDYRETTEAILRLYWQLTLTYRIILAPTGAKMQTVGAFIARAMHPDIHVEYPTPKGFLQFYSKGAGQRWIVNFGRLGAFVESLAARDTREHLAVGRG